MNKNDSFSKFLRSKTKLFEALEDNPKTEQVYSLSKYCKVPLKKTSFSEKEYFSFKPNDKIKILWEMKNGFEPFIIYFSIINEDEYWEKFYPSWSSRKFRKWVCNTTKEGQVIT